MDCRSKTTALRRRIATSPRPLYSMMALRLPTARFAPPPAFACDPAAIQHTTSSCQRLGGRRPRYQPPRHHRRSAIPHRASLGTAPPYIVEASTGPSSLPLAVQCSAESVPNPAGQMLAPVHMQTQGDSGDAHAYSPLVAIPPRLPPPPPMDIRSLYIQYNSLPFTRSGTELSAFSLPKVLSPLQAPDFDVAPLVALAVAAEHDDQEDHEEDDALDAPQREPGNDFWSSTNDGPVFDPLTMRAPSILGDTVVRAVDELQFGGRNTLYAYRGGVTTGVVAPMASGFVPGGIVQGVFLQGVAAAFDVGAANAHALGAGIQDLDRTPRES
ncbi:hypothetical protein DFH09DRAFT_1336809 [Mycena vulgaris]|nr:hypothetical protein DFH09DRAFT_1336809 [Mycena vulgaris]